MNTTGGICIDICIYCIDICRLLPGHQYCQLSFIDLYGPSQFGSFPLSISEGS